MTFTEIERVTGVKLPPSATKHRAMVEQQRELKERADEPVMRAR